MYSFYFERLDVWQHSRKLIKLVYEVSDSFPDKEKYGLVSQVRRSSVSICANISEGFSRKTDKEKARFINMAYSSLWETISHLIISNDLGYLNNNNYEGLRKEAESIARQLSALIARLETSN
ncbi:four helix bundle protein [Robertkochia sediminum]|uniref:four helix bundle protein n=1 Tax=Robertkochia sediminum TaxID=2785326 RepID=UPI0019318C7A|nr:four helix bundle protein [Robertkochia sediminum]MBL7473752.1 four helix bundle protein [Robertkochia sediminum]